MKNKDLKIEIRPIPNKSEIRSYSNNLEYFAQPFTIGAFVNPITLKYETGLSDKDIEELKKRDCPYDISNTYTPGVPHPFWDSQLAKTSLGSSPQFLYPYRTVLDFIKWKYLIASAYVYESEDAVQKATKPSATHYIYNESIELEIKANKIQRMDDIRNKLSKLSTIKKRHLLTVIEDENLSSKSDSYVVTKLSDILKDSDKLSILEDFLNEDNSKVSMLAEVKLAIYKDVLSKKKEGIFFFDTNLGYSEEDVAEFLSDKKNQELYLNIKEKLK